MSPSESPDTETTVRALLVAAHLTVSDDELQQFVKTYPEMRAEADRMYLPETRSEPEPALIYRAEWSNQSA
jgi:hypothetical protein